MNIIAILCRGRNSNKNKRPALLKSCHVLIAMETYDKTP